MTDEGEGLLARLRRVADRYGDMVEKRMVGGRSFARDGRMCCGVTGAGLMVRVGVEGVAAALTEPHVSPMRMGNKALAAFVVVAPAGVRTDVELAAWVARGRAAVGK